MSTMNKKAENTESRRQTVWYVAGMLRSTLYFVIWCRFHMMPKYGGKACCGPSIDWSASLRTIGRGSILEGQSAIRRILLP